MITFNTTNDIDEALDAELEAMQDGVNEVSFAADWFPQSAAEADKQVQKILKLKALKERMQEIAKAEIEEIQIRLDEQLHFYDSEIEGYTRILRVYFEGLDKSEVGETKTQRKHQLLHGSLIMKKPKQVYEKNDAELVEYFEKSGLKDFIKVEKKPAWGEFKKQLATVDGKAVDSTTGEIVPCITVTENPEEFEVK